MCCNGVLFFSMKRQPLDPVRSLAARGLRAKRVDGEEHFLQPCPALQPCLADGRIGTACSIYAHRPERCRAFQCRQLLKVADGTISEDAARETIREAAVLVARVRELFLESGEARTHKPFASRHAAVFTPPLDPAPEAAERRARLSSAWTELETFLEEHFRVEPPARTA